MLVGDPVELLELLGDMGVTVTLDRPTGQLRVRPRPVPTIGAELIRANRPLIFAVLLGADTKHVWARCHTCGAGLMRPRKAKPRRCVFTTRCEGRHVR
jgi:hypothetical protein